MPETRQADRQVGGDEFKLCHYKEADGIAKPPLSTPEDLPRFSIQPDLEPVDAARSTGYSGA